MNFVAAVIGLIVITLSAAIVHGDTDQAWRQAALEKHNEYRRLHAAQTLTISQDLCTMSQKWADHLKSQEGPEKLVHSKTDGVGENLYWSMRGGSGSGDAKVAPEVAVKSWYDEIKDYDFATGESIGRKVTGHFTQVVWKGSKEVCVSYAKKAGGDEVEFFVVANYRPPGNWDGNYINNVARASGPAGLESRKGVNDGLEFQQKGVHDGLEFQQKGVHDGLESRQKGVNDSNKGKRSRNEAQQWLYLFWISLGYISTFSVYL